VFAPLVRMDIMEQLAAPLARGGIVRLAIKQLESAQSVIVTIISM
jgi:hypothetical protein